MSHPEKIHLPRDLVGAHALPHPYDHTQGVEKSTDGRPHGAPNLHKAVSKGIRPDKIEGDRDRTVVLVD